MEPGINVQETFGNDENYIYNHNDYMARGAFGLIYKGKRENALPFGQEEIVAIKVVHLFSEDTEEKLIKQRNRLKKLVELRHENLVAYHKIVLTKLPGGPRIELTMDFYKERDLAYLLKSLQQKERALNLDTALRYAQEIGKGLMFLHNNDIIHGDLKPQNVLARKLGKKKKRLAIGDLDDFVQMQENATSSGDITSFRGTIRYMSPEMLRRMVQDPGEIPGRKTDVWSFGCIMIELADGMLQNSKKWLRKGEKTLERGDQLTNTDFVSAVTDGYVPDLSDLAPETLAACVQSCLYTTSRNRATANDVLAILDAAVCSPKRSLIFIHENVLRARQVVILEISSRQFPRAPLLLKSRSGEMESRHEYHFHEPDCAAVCNSSLYVFHNCSDSKGKRFFVDIIQWSIRQETSTPSFLNSEKAWENVFVKAVVPSRAFCPIAFGSKLYFFAEYQKSKGRLLLVEADTDQKSIRSVFGLRPKM